MFHQEKNLYTLFRSLSTLSLLKETGKLKHEFYVSASGAIQKDFSFSANFSLQ